MTASYTTQCSANKCAAEGLALAMESVRCSDSENR